MHRSEGAVAHRHTGAGAQVRVQLEDDGRYARILVENPGPPVPPEQVERLFECFCRADTSHGRRGETAGSGTGLGLAIVKSIVEAHGGAVEASSRSGWTRFTVTLPSARLHLAEPAPGLAGDREHARNKTELGDHI
jgi:two-component system heavy metal sensor histidine kinase CusS